MVEAIQEDLINEEISQTLCDEQILRLQIDKKLEDTQADWKRFSSFCRAKTGKLSRACLMERNVFSVDNLENDIEDRLLVSTSATGYIKSRNGLFFSERSNSPKS